MTDKSDLEIALELLSHAENALNQHMNRRIQDDTYASTHEVATAIGKFLHEAV